MAREDRPSAGSYGATRASLFALCARCLASCAQEELEAIGRERVCAACAARSFARPECVRVERTPQAVLGEGAAEPRGVAAELLADMRAWSRDAAWLPRLPVLLLLAYWAVRHVTDAQYAGVIDGLNSGVHELGHVVFAAFGSFLGIAGGTLLQCAAPLAGAAMFLRQRDYFAIAFALGWLGTNFFDVAVYVADARTRQLHLVGLGNGEPIHDWGYLLGELGLLESDQTLALALRVFGGLSFALALVLGTWCLAHSWRARRVGA